VREAGEYASELAVRLARRYLPRFLLFTNPSVLRAAVDANITVVDKLYEWIRKAKSGQLDPQRYKVLQLVLGAIEAVRVIAAAQPEVVRQFLKVDVALNAVRESKPELYGILSTERGRKWLERSLRQLGRLIGVM